MEEEKSENTIFFEYDGIKLEIKISSLTGLITVIWSISMICS